MHTSGYKSLEKIFNIQFRIILVSNYERVNLHNFKNLSNLSITGSVSITGSESVKEEGCDIKKWSKHYKIENPKSFPTFNRIVKFMEKKFNVKVMETRLNYYPDEKSWKPLHHDRHSTYKSDSNSDKLKEDFTMGASFGSTRSLSFKHVETKTMFEIPQKNGDIFAFDSNINKLFMHGVPKVQHTVGERFSIIAWGIRL